jgi:hypothetical protein
MGMTAKNIHGVGGGSERCEVTFGKGPINRQLTAIYARDRRRYLPLLAGNVSQLTSWEASDTPCI